MLISRLQRKLLANLWERTSDSFVRGSSSSEFAAAMAAWRKIEASHTLAQLDEMRAAADEIVEALAKRIETLNASYESEEAMTAHFCWTEFASYMRTERRFLPAST